MFGIRPLILYQVNSLLEELLQKRESLCPTILLVNLILILRIGSNNAALKKRDVGMFLFYAGTFKVDGDEKLTTTKMRHKTINSISSIHSSTVATARMTCITMKKYLEKFLFGVPRYSILGLGISCSSVNSEFIFFNSILFQ